MKYVEKAVLGLGVVFLLIVVLYVTVGNNEVFQYSNINDIEGFIAAAAAVAAVVAAAAVAAVVAAAVAAAAVAVVVAAVAVVAADFSITVAIYFFLIYLIMGLVEYFIIKSIERKNLEKSYWLTCVCIVAVFLIGVLKLPTVFENKAFRNMEYYETVVSEARLIDGQVKIEVDSREQGLKLSKHLYFENTIDDSLARYPVSESAVDVEIKGTFATLIRYRLIFNRQPGTLYLFSYNKRREVKINQ